MKACFEQVMKNEVDFNEKKREREEEEKKREGGRVKQTDS